MKWNLQKLFTGFILSAAFLSPALQANDQIRYISAQHTKLFRLPDFTAPVLKQLHKGEEVIALEQKAIWLKVKTSDHQGWISKFVASPTPPLERITVLPGNKKVKLKDIRRRASAITTAAAARGLADVAQGSKADRYVSNPEGVEYMESFKIDKQTLQQFAHPLKREQS